MWEIYWIIEFKFEYSNFGSWHKHNSHSHRETTNILRRLNWWGIWSSQLVLLAAWIDNGDAKSAGENFKRLS